MALHPDLKPLQTAVRRLVAAEVADSWKGGGDPADIPVVERELKEARKKYKQALVDLEEKIENYRGGLPPSPM